MSWFGRLKEGLSRSAGALSQGLAGVFGSAAVDTATLQDLEELLISSDLGVQASARIAAKLGEKRWGPTVPPNEARTALAAAIAAILQPAERPLDVTTAKPYLTSLSHHFLIFCTPVFTNRATHETERTKRFTYASR